MAAVQRASSCIQKFFKSRKKFFGNATGTAWLIVKWRNSWGWGFRAEGGREAVKENFKEPLNNKMLQPIIKHTVISKPKVEKEEWEKESTWQDVSWRNVPVSSLRINSGAIWKTYLAPTCFSWEKRGKEKNWLSLISWASLSPAGSYNITAALSPWSKADTHPLSAGSTDCHSSCQSTAIYLEAWGLLENGKSRGWREMMMKEWDEAEERRGSKRKRESRMRLGILCSLGTSCIWDSAFPYL